MSAITLNNITKTYNKGATLAVDDISFSIEKGELFGLIGPDGAGKTSIFRILTTLLLADKGSATVVGNDVVKDFHKIRGIVGYMPGRFSLYQDLTVEENLNFFATVFGTTVKENYDQIKDIYSQLEPFKTRRAGKLSGGMKQKLALCCALIHKPEVLFLDEPTTGVDVVSRREFWEMLKRLKQQGITIMVSTSYMDEATLCDRIALILGGKILSLDTPANVITAYPEKLYAIKSPNMHHLLKDLRTNDDILTCYAAGEYIHLSLKNGGKANEEQLLQHLKEKGETELILKETTPTVEDCFIRLLGNKDGNSN
jgi:ABC-2 type transport system ATP-binding protein